ncbi:hypothetical protein Tco_0613454 [Tanacetum coccineum]
MFGQKAMLRFGQKAVVEIWSKGNVEIWSKGNVEIWSKGNASVNEIDYVQLGIVNQAELKLQPRAFFSFCTAAYNEVKILSNLLRT